MELIATARFKKAMDRSVAARDYTEQLAKILKNIAAVGGESIASLASNPTDATQCCSCLNWEPGPMRRLQFQRCKTSDGSTRAVVK